MSGFAEIAPYLTNPLVLAGFGLFLFFVLLRSLLRSKVMPTVTQRTGGQALLRAINYGFVVALVVIVLGFAFAWRQTELGTVDVDEILDDFRVATDSAAANQGKLDAIARLNELEARAFRNAVLAIVRERGSPHAPRDIDRAIELLRQGETGAAETVLAEVLDRRLQVRARASEEAAEAARHLGAIAYVNDTAKAIEAYRTATELDPDHSRSWIFLGHLYLLGGTLTAAEKAFNQARAVAEQTGDERDVMVADGSLGTVRVARGDFVGALAAYEAALIATQALAETDPNNAEWQRDLSVSHEAIGDVLVAKGDHAGALQAYEQARAIAKRLAAYDPDKALWQRDLSVRLHKIGDLQVAQGDHADALQTYEQGRAIAEKLAARNPDNRLWQYELGISNERIGDVFLAQGELADAVSAYERKHQIVSALVERDPNNRQWQRDLSVSYERIGDMRVAEGDRAGALESYEQALAIAEKLAVRDPDNALWQRDLIISHVKVAEVATSVRDSGGHHEAALDIARRLYASGRLAPIDHWIIDDLEARLCGAAASRL